ncbi:hypothetical protein ACFS5L_01925 [Streptomyces phyllanthi]|uniref:Uncharacterized protein n=1 Tax=Streptomyces phyllanthi TaxID=1803180 RepID=A0A5N8VUJ0_9ACTN|nr:hypothetical protein [Streptomyces phyllanthi]MPY38452.1 hypothetical protein [Streptomyces phyllanthi]
MEAAESAGLTRVVKVSSYAAGVRPLVPSAATHVEIEARLWRSSLAWPLLRPDWWLDNVLAQIARVRNGEIFFPAGDATISAVDARDLADVAIAELLADSQFGGTLTLTGSDSVTVAEIAERLSRAADIPLSYRDESAPEWPDYYVAGMRKLFASFRARGFSPRTHTIEEVLGKPPRTIEQFGSEVLTAVLRS